MLFELFGELKRRMETQDISDLLYGARRASQEFLSLLQAYLAMVLFWAEANSFGERLPQMRIAYAELGGDGRQTETFLAAQRNECMRALDQLIDPPVESWTALQMTDHGEQVRAHC
jgi:hypothetical protein